MEPASLKNPASDDAVPAWRARRRDAILAAAADLFARQPYALVQMEDVARRADVGKATLYRYFPGKEDLFLAAFELVLHDLELRLVEVREAEAVPEDALAAMIERMVRALAGHLPSLKAMGEEHSGVAARGRVLLNDRIAAIRAQIRLVLEAGIDAGSFRRVDLDVVPQLVISMIRGGIMALGGSAAGRPERLARAVTQLVLDGGLKPAPDPESNANPLQLKVLVPCE